MNLSYSTTWPHFRPIILNSHSLHPIVFLCKCIASIYRLSCLTPAKRLFKKPPENATFSRTSKNKLYTPANSYQNKTKQNASSVSGDNLLVIQGATWMKNYLLNHMWAVVSSWLSSRSERAFQCLRHMRVQIETNKNTMYRADAAEQRKLSLNNNNNSFLVFCSGIYFM